MGSLGKVKEILHRKHTDIHMVYITRCTSVILKVSQGAIMEKHMFKKSPWVREGG